MSFFATMIQKSHTDQTFIKTLTMMLVLIYTYTHINTRVMLHAPHLCAIGFTTSQCKRKGFNLLFYDFTSFLFYPVMSVNRCRNINKWVCSHLLWQMIRCLVKWCCSLLSCDIKKDCINKLCQIIQFICYAFVLWKG